MSRRLIKSRAPGRTVVVGWDSAFNADFCNIDDDPHPYGVRSSIVLGTAIGQFTEIDAFLIEVSAIAFIPVLLRWNLINDRVNEPHDPVSDGATFARVYTDLLNERDRSAA